MSRQGRRISPELTIPARPLCSHRRPARHTSLSSCSRPARIHNDLSVATPVTTAATGWHSSIRRIWSGRDRVCSHMPRLSPDLSAESCGLVEDAFDLPAVDVEFAGDGALAVAGLMSCADGLL